jgi:hypothetical protein
VCCARSCVIKAAGNLTNVCLLTYVERRNYTHRRLTELESLSLSLLVGATDGRRGILFSRPPSASLFNLIISHYTISIRFWADCVGVLCGVFRTWRETLHAGLFPRFLHTFWLHCTKYIANKAFPSMITPDFTYKYKALLITCL